MRFKLKQIALAGLLTCLGASAMAANYFFVQPKSGEMSNLSPISLAMAPAALPQATVGMVYNTTGYDFAPNLAVTGDPNFNASLATFALISGNIPAGMVLSSTGKLTGTPTAASTGTSLQVAATYKTITSSRSYHWVATAAAPTSCAAVLAATPGSPSGWYTFDVDGAGPADSQSYYCDMTSDGGGWTRIVRQTEEVPVTNWNGGVTGASYALSTVQIPTHTQVGFGKDEQATFVDYVNWGYTTGQIFPGVRLLGLKTGLTYDVARITSGFYSYGNPEESYIVTASANVYGDGDWRNSLNFDRTGGRGFDWTFNPQHLTPAARGQAMTNGLLITTSQSYAWTVWVR